MHEIRATVPPDFVDEAARLAQSVGINRVTVAEVFVHGPGEYRQQLSVETSTPKARAFVEAVLTSRALARTDYTLTSREVRSIVDDQSLADITLPMVEPFPDVIQDLWQLSYISYGYLSRAAAGGILLATGVIENNPIAIVIAALFLPFLSEVLAVAFGLWSRDRGLIVQGCRAVLISTIISLGTGAAVAAIEGGPIQFTGFKGPWNSFAISAAIGIASGLSSADDTGRRYLIGVAAAVQFAIFPAWFGAALVLGLPSHEVVYQRLLSFAINLVTISVAALLAFASLHTGPGCWTAPASNRGTRI